jgi:hypothetical protein
MSREINWNFWGPLIGICGIILFFATFMIAMISSINSREVSLEAYKNIKEKLGNYVEYDKEARKALKDEKLTYGEYTTLDQLYIQLEKRKEAENLKKETENSIPKKPL